MKKRSFSPLAFLILLLLVLGACGDGGNTDAADEPPDDSDAGEPADDEAPEELETVTAGFVSLHTWHWWALVAQEEGLMEPHGIDLDIVTFQGTDQIAAALLSGSAQFGSVTPEGIFPAQDEEPTMKMVASGLAKNPYTFITAPEIQDYEDLRGQTIGVNSVGSSADYFTAKLMMLEHGLEEGADYEFVNAGTPSDRLAAMSAGQLQAVLNFEPAAYVLLDEGMQALEASADYPRLAEVEVATLVADEDWYTENRELAENFLRGFRDAMDWLHDPANRERAVELLAEEMNVSTEHADNTYERFVVDLGAWDREGKISLERLRNTFQNARDGGVEGVPEDDDLEWRFDNSLIESIGEDR